MRRLSSLVVLLAFGCQSDAGLSGLDLAAVDPAADPCVDFYRYACGGWIDGHPLGDEGGYQSRFYDPYYEALPRLQRIMEQDAAGRRTPVDPHAALIGSYFSTCMAAPGDLSSRDTMRELLAQIDEVTTLEELARQTANQRDLGSSAFFQVGVGADLGDASRNIVSVDQGGLGLPDRSYYLDRDHAGLRADYPPHIETLVGLIGGTPIDTAAVLRIETALAEAALPPDERRNPAELYHPMAADEVSALAPTFPWQAFWDEARLTDLERVNVVDPSYLMAVDALLQDTPLDDLKSYLRWRLLQDHVYALDQAVLDESFRFVRYYSGRVAPAPRSFTCLNSTLSTLGAAVALPYVALYFDEATREPTSAIVERMRAAFAGRLQRADWLDAPTRDEALVKLDALAAKIGYPAEPVDYSGLVLDPFSYLDDGLALTRFAYQKNRERLGQPVDRAEWRLTPVTVNAIYSPTVNDLTLPAALLTTPFLVPGRSHAANLGALGALVGHEMSHAFDDQGRQFDETGTLRDWWTPEVAARFSERAQCLVDQFDAFEPLPGMHVNGALTLGKNIADLGGLSIAYDALNDGSEQPTGGDGFSPAQVFFLSYAQTWCEVARPETLSNLLLTDGHSPGEYRVNGPLSNHPGFREAFACPEGSPMVRPAASMCAVW